MTKAKSANKSMTPDEEKKFRDEMIGVYKERELTEPGFREIRESFIRTISKPISCPDYTRECIFKVGVYSCWDLEHHEYHCPLIKYNKEEA